MNNKVLHFSAEEFRQRLVRVQQAMEARNLGLLLVTDPANMNWITGYDAWSFYTHQCVLVKVEGAPVWYGRNMDARCARVTVWLEDEQIWAYPDHYVQSPERHPMDYLAGLLDDHGMTAERIGVEKDNYYFTAACLESLLTHLPGTEFVDCTGLVNFARSVKSAQEIEYMRIAGRIVDRMHQRILETARPGIPKDQVVAEVYQTGISGIEGAGGDYPSIVPLVCAGAEAATPHLTWNSELLRRDEGVFFEVAGVHKRYHCPTSRTLYFGKPPKKFIEAEKAVLEGIDAGLDRAQPGQRCEDISKAFFDTMARHGVHKEGRCGYGIGLSYPPDWGEHTFSLRPGDDTVLAAGMAFHFMPALWFDDWGLEITETVLITGAGHECLSHVERKLLVVD